MRSTPFALLVLALVLAGCADRATPPAASPEASASTGASADPRDNEKPKGTLLGGIKE